MTDPMKDPLAYAAMQIIKAVEHPVPVQGRKVIEVADYCADLDFGCTISVSPKGIKVELWLGENGVGEFVDTRSLTWDEVRALPDQEDDDGTSED